MKSFKVRIKNKINNLSLFEITLTLISLLINQILFLVFRFKRWHKNTTFYSRSYKKIVTEIVNQNLTSNLDCIIDLGCGLGDITNKIKSKNKFGYDLDSQVIKGARIKNFDFNTYHYGSINEIIKNKNIKKIDFLIAVNFLHSIDSSQILDQIILLNKSKPIKWLVLDELIETTSQSPIYHNFSELFKGFAKENKKVFDKESRAICLLRVINNE